MRGSTLIVLLGNGAWCASAAHMLGFEIPSFELQAQHMRGSFSPHALWFLKKREISRVESLLSPITKLFTRTVDEDGDNEEGDDYDDQPQDDSPENADDGKDLDSSIIADGQLVVTNLTAGQAWEKYRKVDDAYFTKHPMTLYESRPDLFFNEFMDSYKDSDPLGCKKA